MWIVSGNFLKRGSGVGLIPCGVGYTPEALAGDRYRPTLPQRSHGALPAGVNSETQSGRRFDEDVGAISWTARHAYLQTTTSMCTSALTSLNDCEQSEPLGKWMVAKYHD